MGSVLAPGERPRRRDYGSRVVNGRLRGTISSWGKYLGVPPSTATKLAKKSGIVPDEDGTIDYLDAKERLEACTRPDNSPEWTAKQKLEAAMRKKLEAKGVDHGKLVPRLSGDRRLTGAQRLEQRVAEMQRLLGVTEGDEEAAEAENDANLAENALDGFQVDEKPSKIAENHQNSPNLAPSDAQPGAVVAGMSIEDIDTLSIEAFVAKLMKDGKLTHKLAADFTLRMVQIKQEVHELRKTVASLVPLQAVRDFEAQVLTDLRGALLPIGGELRDDLAACDDPVRCQEMVDDRIYGALRQVASYKPAVEAPPSTVGPGRDRVAVQ